jgi:hypothetical protein
MTPPPNPRRDRPAERRRKLLEAFPPFNPADSPVMGGGRAKPPAEAPREQATLLDLDQGGTDRR